MTSWRIIEGDCRQSLATLDAGSVQTCVTSPPYFGLRDYGHPGQIGLERNLLEYVTALRTALRAVHRVLRDDGTLWLNIGDSYDKRKNLIGVPWNVANRLKQDGWLLRSDIIWAKPDAQPESVTDRPASAHEHVFLLTKSSSYLFDWQALGVPFKNTDAQRRREAGIAETHVRSDQAATHKSGNLAKNAAAIYQHGIARPRDVWDVPLREPESDRWRGHGAMMPMRLAHKCITAGSRPGDVVLDPFAGSGTTGLVSLRQGRSFVGCELNPEYADLARDRIRDDAPLTNTIAEAA